MILQKSKIETENSKTNVENLKKKKKDFQFVAVVVEFEVVVAVTDLRLTF